MQALQYAIAPGIGGSSNGGGYLPPSDCRFAGSEQVDYHGFLFAALALQLALSLAGAESLYTCSGCGFPYVRELKRPKPGTANYCPKCSEKGVAQRRAVDAYREKKAEAIRLEATGAPADEIARKLSTPVSRIRKWLGKGPTAEEQRKRRRVK